MRVLIKSLLVAIFIGLVIFSFKSFVDEYGPINLGTVIDQGENINNYFGNVLKNALESIGDNSQGIQDTEETAENENSSEPSTEPMDQTLKVHFLDVGQGDCTLISIDGHYLLIDAGDNNKGTAVQNYLQKQGVEYIDYFILTHPDADHIGGADVIITKFDVGMVIMPDCEKDTATYRDVVSAMEYRYIAPTYPVVGTEYSLGDASFVILAPQNSYEDVNANSVVIKLTYGEDSFLFVGDCEEEEENEILESGQDISADVLKVGHHGSKSSSGEEFVSAVSPTYAVISCGEGNEYGHPHAKTLNTLRAAGVLLYRTDEQGTIIAKSNGAGITWDVPPTETWQAGN